MIYGAYGREKRREITRYLNITEEKDQRLFETTNLKKLISFYVSHPREFRRTTTLSAHTFAIGLESQRRVSAVFARLNDAAFYIRSACTCGMRLAILRGDASRPRGR